MKTLIAAVIASAVSFGAFAQTTPAASAPMAKPTASDSGRQEEQHEHPQVELDVEQEAPQQQQQEGVGASRLSAPARTKARSRPGFFSWCARHGRTLAGASPAVS